MSCTEMKSIDHFCFRTAFFLIITCLTAYSSADSRDSRQIPVQMLLDPDSPGLLDGGFPSDHLKDQDGCLKWSKWSYPQLTWPQAYLMESAFYQSVCAHHCGFSPMMNLYLRFDRAELTHKDLALPEAFPEAVQLIDIDPDSPAYGRRHAIQYTINGSGDSLYGGQLEVKPTGWPLKENTTYALIVKNNLLKAPYALLQSAELGSLIGSQPRHRLSQAMEFLYPVYEPLRMFLEETKTDAGDIVAAIVWTTGGPTSHLRELTQQVLDRADQYIKDHVILNSIFPDNGKNYCVIKGAWNAPLFVADLYEPGILFDTSLNFSPEGQIVPAAERLAEFYIAIPRKPVPQTGYPLVIYNPGTSGDGLQFIRRGQTTIPGDLDFTRDDRPYTVADMLTDEGIAVASMAPYMGKEYCLWDANFTFLTSLCSLLAYNPYRPESMITTLYQMVFERLLFRRLLSQLKVPGNLCQEAGENEIFFDDKRQALMGQSLGSMVSAGVAAVDPKPYQALVLTGAGNYGAGLPVYFRHHGIGALVERFLFAQSSGGLTRNPFHPLWALSELALSPANLAQHINHRIHSNKLKAHVLVIEGVDDDMVTPAMQLELLRGLEVDYAGMEPEGLADDQRLLPTILKAGGSQARCVQANRDKYTVAVVQYPRDKYLSGHHVAFQVPEARKQYSSFLSDVMSGKVPKAGLCQ